MKIVLVMIYTVIISLGSRGMASMHVTCQSINEVKKHIYSFQISKPKLVNENGIPVSDIDSRFCVRTISEPVNLQVAIADAVRGYNGASFDEAQIACKALTPTGSWSLPLLSDACPYINYKPYEKNTNRSFNYFINSFKGAEQEVIAGHFGPFWTASKDLKYNHLHVYLSLGIYGVNSGVVGVDQMNVLCIRSI